MAISVDFNGLRRSACNNFDKVVEAALKCREEHGPDSSFEDLAEAIDELRSSIAGIALCYDEHGNKDVLGDRTLLSMSEDDDENDAPFTLCECGRPINECVVMDGGDQHHDNHSEAEREAAKEGT